MRVPCLPLLLVLSLLTASLAAAAPDREVLYQVSTLDALLAGVFDRASSVGDLLTHGDTGLGCFTAVDGEMVVLDGVAYQVRSDGTVHRATPHMGTPFAAVTFLDRDRELQLTEPLDFKALGALLDRQLPTRNLFTVARLDGDFAYLKTRSVPRQQRPYPKLLAVAMGQSTFEYRAVPGTLVAIFCPYFVTGANMPGWHYHFLDRTRTKGGHVLDLQLTRGTLVLDVTPRFTMSLPETGPYTETVLEKTNKAEMEQVEKDRK